MTTQRRHFPRAGATTGVAAGALAFPMIATAQQKFNWKMTSAYPKCSPFYMAGRGLRFVFAF